VAEEYERVRSRYPAALVDKACAVAGLEPGDAVVEIGCGTGKLTRELAGRGLVVDAVEPDAELAAVARRIVPEPTVRFHIGTFEDVELPRGAYRAVFAATSFHWVDPAVGWSKVASLLEPNGVFALLSHGGGMRGALDEDLVRVWREFSTRPWSREPVDDETLWAGAEERKGNVSELWSWLAAHDLTVPEAAELFSEVKLTKEPMERAMPLQDYLALIRTTNNYLHLAPEQQQGLERELAGVIGRHGGTYPAHGYATLVTARRV